MFLSPSPEEKTEIQRKTDLGATAGKHQRCTGTQARHPILESLPFAFTPAWNQPPSCTDPHPGWAGVVRTFPLVRVSPRQSPGLEGREQSSCLALNTAVSPGGPLPIPRLSLPHHKTGTLSEKIKSIPTPTASASEEAARQSTAGQGTSPCFVKNLHLGLLPI